MYLQKKMGHPRIIIFIAANNKGYPPLQLAAELSAHAVSHLENVSETGIEAMAQAGVVGVLLPTTAYILRLHPPPARRMIEKGQSAVVLYYLR